MFGPSFYENDTDSLTIRRLDAVVLPSLSRLTLVKMALCSDSFCTFLKRHKALTQLGLKKIMMVNGVGWHNVFKAIKGHPGIEMYDFNCLLTGPGENGICSRFDSLADEPEDQFELDTTLYVEDEKSWTKELADCWS